MRNLAAELRAGGAGTVLLAISLGALHALTPGHGKSALVAYFLGQESHLGKGLRVALVAALLHVLSGFVAFLILRFIVGQSSTFMREGSPTIAAIGYGLIALAGATMLLQSMRWTKGSGLSALTAGVGLLPCPLTITVLGFAWIQSSAMMVGLVVISLAVGISLTIGAVAILAILARDTLDERLLHRLPQLERVTRILQGAAAILIIAFALSAFLQARA